MSAAVSAPCFAGQTALMTRGTSGLGVAIARRLRPAGAFFALLDFIPAAFAALAAEFGDEAMCVGGEATDEAQVRQTVDAVRARRGRIDILVNSAGVTGRTGVCSHEVTPAAFEFVLKANPLGCFLTARKVIPGVLERGFGRVLHIASIAGKDGNAGMAAYSASKAAVIGLTKVQGKEYAESGVTVNALAPAVIRTPMVAAMPAAQVGYMTEKIPIKRCGTLEEVAATAAFIGSAEAAFTTGFTFDLSGGRAVY